MVEIALVWVGQSMKIPYSLINFLMFLKVNSFIGGAHWGLAFGFPFDDDARVDFKVCYPQFSHFQCTVFPQIVSGGREIFKRIIIFYIS